MARWRSSALRSAVVWLVVVAQFAIKLTLLPPPVKALELRQETKDEVSTSTPPAATSTTPVEESEPVLEAAEEPAPLFPDAATLTPDQINPPIAIDSAVDALPLPNTPLNLSLSSDQIVLGAGTAATLHLALYRPADNSGDVDVTITLPTGLLFSNDGSATFVWHVPASPEKSTFSQQVEVQAVAELAYTQSVLTIAAIASGAGYRTATTTLTVGVAPTVDTGVTSAASDPNAAVSAIQTATGAILQAVAGRVTLLSGAQSAEAGVTFAYTPLFRVDQADELAAQPLPVSQPVTETQASSPDTTGESEVKQSVFLPFVAGDVGAESTTAAGQVNQPVTADQQEAAPTHSLRPRWSNNIMVYQEWQFTAQQNGAEVSIFEQPLTLVVDAGWLTQEGVSLDQLNLWTRETITQSWQPLRLVRDHQHQRLIAQVPHFSYFAAGPDPTTQWLPSTRAFDSDRFTGGASVNYPIETLAGAGGMAPNLSLLYSSNSVDDVIQNSGYTAMRSQASTIGYGWTLGGISSVQMTQDMDKNRSYALVLDGARYDILNGLANPQMDPAAFAQITYTAASNTWVVTNTNGVRYTFVPKSATYYPIDNSNMHHVTDGWYLAEMRNPLGSIVTFEYSVESGKIHASCGINQGSGQYDYTRSVLLTRVAWGGEIDAQHNPVANSEKMQIRLEYDAARIDIDYYGEGYVVDQGRTDWEVVGWPYNEYDNNCIQAQFTPKSLDRILVEVKDSETGQWHRLHRYELNNTNYLPERQLLLHNIQHYGKQPEIGQPDPLQETYSFGYTDYNQLGNNVRLVSANNGYGGTVQYTYLERTLDYCESGSQEVPCTYSDKRYPVKQIVTSDGIGNSSLVSYTYVTGVMNTLRNGSNHFIGRDFLGYNNVMATTYEVNSGTSQPLRFDHFFFHQGITTTSGFNTDLRRGKLYQHEVWNLPPGASNRLLLSTEKSGWVATSNNGGTWVRLDQQQVWSDKAGQLKRFFYDTDRQGGQQFGNVTKVEEWSHPESVLAQTTWNTRVASDTLTLYRTTTTLFVPNFEKHIVSLPTRVRIYEGSDQINAPDDNLTGCKSEARMIYASNANGNYSVTPPNGLVHESQQALSSCNNATTTIGTRDPQWAVAQMLYDDYGNLVQQSNLGASSTDDQIIHTSYDSYYHLFPTEAYHDAAPQHRERRVYYGVNASTFNAPAVTATTAYWGRLAEECGSNEVCQRYAYDGLARPTQRWQGIAKGSAWSLNTPETAHTAWLYAEYHPISQTAYMISEWNNPRCYGNFTRQLYNGLGQLIQTQGPAHGWKHGCGNAPSGDEVAVDYAYNALGQQRNTSVPHLVSHYASGDIRRPADWSKGIYTTTYDSLGRAVKSITPDAVQTLYYYEGRKNWVVAQLGANTSKDDRVLKWQETDPLSNLRSVRTQKNISTQPGQAIFVDDGIVWLTHDVVGNLRCVHHAGAGVDPSNDPDCDGSFPPFPNNPRHVTRIQYDLAGRKQSMNDADMGAWGYTYDRLGRLLTQTDARGTVTTLSYDARGRVDSKQIAQGVSIYSIDYDYDAGHNPAGGVRSWGQLTSVAYSDGRYSKWLTYSAQGLLASEAVSITGSNQVYTTSYGYDEFLRPFSTGYPDGDVVTAGYNSMGLQSLLVSSHNGVVVGNATYDEAGRLLNYQMPRGTSLWRHQSYFPWTNNGTGNGNALGRLDTIRIVSSSDPNSSTAGVMKLANHQYDALGNIKSYQDANGVDSPHVYFDYDSLNRLTAGYKPSGGDTNPAYRYDYDVAGRITNFEGVSLNASFGPAHAVSPITATYQYDLNGNVTQRVTASGQVQTLVWNAENRLQRVEANGTTIESYVYDPEGQRVQKTQNGLPTFYINPNYEVELTYLAPSQWPTQTDTIWYDDAFPGTVMTTTWTGDNWRWEAIPAPRPSGVSSLRSNLRSGTQNFGFQPYPVWNPKPMTVLRLAPDDLLYFYVRRDTPNSNAPLGILVNWAYEDHVIDYLPGTFIEQYTYRGVGLGDLHGTTDGALPPAGVWSRIEVSAAALGIERKTLAAMDGPALTALVRYIR